LVGETCELRPDEYEFYTLGHDELLSLMRGAKSGGLLRYLERFVRKQLSDRLRPDTTTAKLLVHSEFFPIVLAAQECKWMHGEFGTEHATAALVEVRIRATAPRE
jgi:hypothetical protein